MAKQSKKDNKVKLKDVLEVTCWVGISILAIVIGIACMTGDSDDNTPGLVPAEISGFIYNPDRQLALATVEKVNSRLRTLMRKTTAEVVVAVVPNTGELTIEDWSQQTFESLGIGKKDKDNGLLLVIATDQHEARIHTGYGLEGVLPDIICSRILRGFVNPKMAQGKLDAAVDSTTMVLESILTDPANADEFVSKYATVPSAVASFDRERRKMAHKDDEIAAGYWTLGAIMFIILFIVIVPKVYTPRRARYKKGPLPTPKKTKCVECPECHKRRYHLMLDMVIKAPRYTNDGKGMRTNKCDACGHSDKEEYTIGRLKKWSLDGFLSFIVFAATMKNTGDDDDNDYSSGGDYSNSSSGGGFSGGSSGGGGASSDW